MSPQKIDSLFYELDIETSKLEGGSARAVKAFRDMQGASTHAGLALGGVGLAIASIGVKALQMGAAIDKVMRSITGLVPAATHEIAALRREIELLGQGARTQQQIADAALKVAEAGVASTRELESILKSSLKLSDATGHNLENVIGGVDAASKLFGISVEDLGDSMNRVFAVTQGKANLLELFQAFQTGQADVQKLGLDVETTTRGLVALMAAGNTGRGLTQKLGELADAGAEGKRQFAGMADAVGDATGNLNAMEDAINRNKRAMDEMGQSAGNKLNTILLAIGESIGDKLNPSLDALLILMGKFDNIADALQLKGAIDNITGITKAVREAGNSATIAQIDQLKKAITSLTQVGGPDGLFPHGRLGFDDKKAFPDDALLRYTDAMKTLGERAGGTSQQMEKFRADIEAADKELAKRGLSIDILRKGEADSKTEPLIAKAKAELATVRTAIQDALSKGTRAAVADANKAADDFASHLKTLEGAIGEPWVVGVAQLGLFRAAISRTSDDLSKDLVKDLQKLEEGLREFGFSLTQAINLDGPTDLVKQAESALASFNHEIDNARKNAEKMPGGLQKFNALLPDIIVRQAQLTKGIGDAKDFTAKLAAGVRELAALEIRDLIAETTITQVDNLDAALARALVTMRKENEEAEKLSNAKPHSAAFIASFEQIRKSGIETVKVLESVRKTLGNRTEFGKDDIPAIMADLDKLDRKIAEVNQTEADRNALLVERVRLEGILDGIVNGKKPPADDKLQNLRAQQQVIEGTVRAAIQLGEAFGFINTNAGQALSAIGQIAANIKTLAAAPKFDFSSALGIAGGVASLVSAIGSIFGDSPEEKAAQDLQRKNIDALNELRASLDNFQLNLTGNQSTGIPLAAEAIRGVDSFKDVHQALRRVGLTMDDVRDAAQKLDITLDENSLSGFADSVEQLGEAVLVARKNMNFWSGDFGHQMDVVMSRWAIFGADFAEQFGDVIGVASGPGGNKAFNAFAGLDLSKPEDRARAHQIAEDLWDALAKGLLNTGLLTPEEFNDILVGVDKWIDDADEKFKEVVRVISDFTSDLDRALDIGDIEDLGERFTEAVARFAEEFPELAALFDFGGLDLTSADDIAAAKAKNKALFEQGVKEGRQDLIDAAVFWDNILDEAAQAIADSIRTAADVVSEAFADMDLTLKIMGADFDKQAVSFAKVVAKAVPSLAHIFDGIDLDSIDTQQERDALRDAIRKWWEKRFTIDPELLGGLGLSDIGAFLVDFLGILDGIDGNLPDAAHVETVSEAMGRLRDKLDLLNVDSPLDVFAATVEELGKKFPLLGDAFKGLDLSTADGIKRAQEIIAVLTQAGSSGVDYWTALGWTKEEFFAALLEIDSGLDGLADAVETAADRMNDAVSLLNTSFELLDIDDPSEKFKRFVDVIRDFAPALAESLTGLDTSSEGGRKAAKDAIKNIFEQILAGDFDLGGMSRDDLLRILTDANRILESIPDDIAEQLADPSNAASRTSGSLAAFGATERSVVRLTDIASSQLFVLREMRDAIVASMRPLAPLYAPSVSAGAFGQASQSTSVRTTITVNVYGGATKADGDAAAAAVSDAMAAQLDRSLGLRHRIALLEAGKQRVE